MLRTVLLLLDLALEEFSEARFTFDKHPPLQQQSISVDAVAITSTEDWRVLSISVAHSNNWGMEEQHNGPHSFRNLAFQVPNLGITL